MAAKQPFASMITAPLQRRVPCHPDRRVIRKSGYLPFHLVAQRRERLSLGLSVLIIGSCDWSIDQSHEPVSVSLAKRLQPAASNSFFAVPASRAMFHTRYLGAQMQSACCWGNVGALKIAPVCVVYGPLVCCLHVLFCFQQCLFLRYHASFSVRDHAVNALSWCFNGVVRCSPLTLACLCSVLVNGS